MQHEPHQQLRAAWLEWRKVNPRKRTLAALLKRARLPISIVSLSRKLSGQQTLTDPEIAAIAKALGVEVSVTRTVVTLGAAA